MDFFDWLVHIFHVVVDFIANIPGAIYDALAWAVSHLINLIVELMVAIAMFFIGLLPEAAPVVPGAPPIHSWVFDGFTAMNVFIDMKTLGAFLGLMMGFEIINQLIHFILWVKRFIPFMGH